MAAFPGSIAFDEFGKPFIILRDQGAQKRLTGNDAIKVSFGHGAMDVDRLIIIANENKFVNEKRE